MSMSTEQKFTLSADTVLDWLAKLRKGGHLPLPIVAALGFIDQLRGKRLELIIKTVGTTELQLTVRAAQGEASQKS
jgi:hypothetical protein